MKKTHTLEEQLESSVQAAVEAAKPHLLEGWRLAVQLGQVGPFPEWVQLVFNDLAEEAHATAARIPRSERQVHLHSPWS